MIITKEKVAEWIKEYADKHPGPGNVIRQTLGSNGTSWSNQYKDGMWAMCEGIAESINNEVNDYMKQKVVALREKTENAINTQWKPLLVHNFNKIKQQQFDKVITTVPSIDIGFTWE